MRVMVMTGPVPTHLMPLLPQVWALRGAGHRVLLAAQPDLAATARAAGLPMAVIGTEQREIAARRAHRAAGGRDAGGDTRQVPPYEALARRLRDRMDDVLGPALRVAREWRPDLVLADPLEYASLVVGGVLGVPVVHHRWGVDSLSSRVGHVRDALRETCLGHGLTGGLPAPALVLDPCPPSLQAPGATPARPVRFVPGTGSGLVPDWASRKTARRRICVTLGLRTVALEGAAVLARLLQGLGRLPDTETVVTVDPADRAELGPLPRSVRLVDPAPLDLFLTTCDAVVHHGGSGTGLAAIAAGLPQLVVPQTPWTAEHGERVEALGAGLLAPQSAAPEDIAAAAGELLADPRHRDGARRLREEMRATPSPAETVPALVRLAGRERGTGAAPLRVEASSSAALHHLAAQGG
ncbi:nucleotide disphospho-sugar-binding domain-containing protein [Streptomyces montanisoli]|uniref:DUF1205 domain-containing protein n=1 Tax=Streptomyces montanisoli TaxID=2798581 RepID=A0A940MDY7_9ACTN|nr:nucleotide disphospho-sugar-binding domain-containing protein [Streptomyces montanisoli]MBP0461294.1 DUF1205 domain-containing protein [Streptomyces montanisoli]